MGQDFLDRQYTKDYFHCKYLCSRPNLIKLTLTSNHNKHRVIWGHGYTVNRFCARRIGNNISPVSRQRNRERETERETEKQINRQREWQRSREIHTDTERETEKPKERGSKHTATGQVRVRYHKIPYTLVSLQQTMETLYLGRNQRLPWYYSNHKVT